MYWKKIILPQPTYFGIILNSSIELTVRLEIKSSHYDNFKYSRNLCVESIIPGFYEQHCSPLRQVQTLMYLHTSEIPMNKHHLQKLYMLMRARKKTNNTLVIAQVICTHIRMNKRKSTRIQSNIFNKRKKTLRSRTTTRYRPTNYLIKEQDEEIGEYYQDKYIIF